MQVAEFRSQIKVSSQVSDPKLSALRTDTAKQSSQLISNEVEKLKEFNIKIEEVIKKIKSNKSQCQQTVNSLQSQINELDKKIALHQTQQNGLKIEQQETAKIKQHQNELLSVCKQRFKLANSINIKILCSIQIEDKKCKANQIFKWVLTAIYNEGSNKFFWPNFKQEALENDKGVDFIQRLGKVSPANLKEEQKLKTDQFLQNFKEYVAASEVSNAKEELEKIYQIAIQFKRGSTILSEIKQKEIFIEKHREETMEKDEQFVRLKARSQALKDRVGVNEKYLQILGQTEQKLQPKLASYREMTKNGKKLQSEIESEVNWSPSINLGHEQKSNCECKIF